MELREMTALACSLAMDTFAVSLVFGTRECLLKRAQIMTVAFIFALVQSGFITIAWQAGSKLGSLISSFDHWVAFILLAAVAVHMLREGKAKIYAPLQPSSPEDKNGEDEKRNPASSPECVEMLGKLGAINRESFLPASPLILLGLGVATSIDSLGAGVGISMLGNVGWLFSAIVFGVTFLFSAFGAFLGRKARSITRLGGWAYVAGGMILLSLGMDILYKHGVF